MTHSIMWQYIDEEPNIIQALLKSKEIYAAAKQLSQYDSVCFIAHGSSYNAAVTVQDFFRRMTGLHTEVHTPSDFLYNRSLDDSSCKTIIIAISQTGTSRGLLQAVVYAKKQNLPVLGITAQADSPLEQYSIFTCHLCCGEELSNAKTKGYTSTLCMLLLLAAETGVYKGHITDEVRAAVIEEIKRSTDEMPDLRKQVCDVLTGSHFGKDMRALYALGTGMNFGTAMECQLKLMETECIPTAFNDIGEFSHGMHRSVSNQISSIIIDHQFDHDDTITAWKFLSANGRESLLITDDASIKDAQVIHIENMPLTQSILLATMAIQVISVFVPELNGLDPNRPSHNELTDQMKTRV